MGYPSRAVSIWKQMIKESKDGFWARMAKHSIEEVDWYRRNQNDLQRVMGR
jgi:hypothetical protein